MTLRIFDRTANPGRGETADGQRASHPEHQVEVFSEVVHLLERHGGACSKGDAMGGRLSDARLPLESVEGRVAHVVYGNRVGDSVLRRVSPIAAILAWAGVCENKKGELWLIDGERSS